MCVHLYVDFCGCLRAYMNIRVFACLVLLKFEYLLFLFDIFNVLTH